MIRVSCDTVSQIEAILRVAASLERRGVKPYRLFIYLLVTKDVVDAEYRVERLKSVGNITI